MPLSAEALERLESKISDGIVPPCPVCKSTLSVSEVQEGESGAKGRNYFCSKDNLGEDEKHLCDLEPGMAFVSWKKNIGLTYRNKIIKAILAGAGVIGAAALTHIESVESALGWNGDEPPVIVDSTHIKQNEVLQAEIEELKKKFPGTTPDPIDNGDGNDNLSSEDWLVLGLGRSGGKISENLQNGSAAVDHLILALKKGLNDVPKRTAIGRLLVAGGKLTEFKKWQEIKSTLSSAGVKWTTEHLNRAILNYNFARCKDNSDAEDARSYRCKALAAYYQYKKSLGGTLPDNRLAEVKESLALIHGFEKVEEDGAVEELLARYSNPEYCP